MLQARLYSWLLKGYNNQHTCIHTWLLAITTFQLGFRPSFSAWLMLCALILYVGGLTYNGLRTTDFWETFSWQVYLPSEFLPEICWEVIAKEIFFVFFFDRTLPTRLRRLLMLYTAATNLHSIYSKIRC